MFSTDRTATSHPPATAISSRIKSPLIMAPAIAAAAAEAPTWAIRSVTFPAADTPGTLVLPTGISWDEDPEPTRVRLNRQAKVRQEGGPRHEMRSHDQGITRRRRTIREVQSREVIVDDFETDHLCLHNGDATRGQRFELLRIRNVAAWANRVTLALNWRNICAW